MKMAFRKKFTRGRRRTFRTPFAKKRRTWVTSIRTGCNFLVVPFNPPVEQCDQLFKLVLLDNDTLESQFSDRAVVKRIIGDLWLTPTFSYAYGTNGENYNALATQGNQFLHLGLLNKDLSRDPTGNLVTPTYNPVISDYDYGEAEWLKTWQHLWTNVDNNVTLQLQAQDAADTVMSAVQCSNTFTSGIGDNIFTDGSGTINIETECNPPECIACPAVAGLTGATAMVSIPRPWHVHFDVKKSIPMREGRELYIHGDWAITDLAGPVNPDDWKMSMYGAVKLLLEY